MPRSPFSCRSLVVPLPCLAFWKRDPSNPFLTKPAAFIRWSPQVPPSSLTHGESGFGSSNLLSTNRLLSTFTTMSSRLSCWIRWVLFKMICIETVMYYQANRQSGLVVLQFCNKSSSRGCRPCCTITGNMPFLASVRCQDGSSTDNLGNESPQLFATNVRPPVFKPIM